MDIVPSLPPDVEAALFRFFWAGVFTGLERLLGWLR
jgi:hypothetical protein